MQVLNTFRAKNQDIVSTIEILEEYQGGYYKNTNTASSISFNNMAIFSNDRYKEESLLLLKLFFAIV